VPRKIRHQPVHAKKTDATQLAGFLTATYNPLYPRNFCKPYVLFIGHRRNHPSHHHREGPLFADTCSSKKNDRNMKIIANKDSLLNLTYHWLGLYNIHLTPASLKKAMHSHPDYPSVAALTDTLDNYKIENAALRLDPEQLPEVPTPFLAHVRINYAEDFVLVEKLTADAVSFIDPDGKPLTKPIAEFTEMWQKVIVLMEPGAGSGDPEDAEFRKKQAAKQQKLGLLAAALGIISLLSILASPFSITHVITILLSLLGIGISSLILLHEFGEDNALTHKLCNTDNNTGCDAVLKSKGSKIFGWLGLEDAAIVYFTGTFIAAVLAGITGSLGSVLPVLAIVSAAVMPVTLYSLYYQKFVVKKWCRMCLITVGVLWLSFIALLPQLFAINATLFNLPVIALLVFAFAVPTLAWMYFKPLLVKEQGLDKKTLEYLKLKRNTDIYWSLWQRQRGVDVFPWANDLVMGNPKGALQIMTACNPYCGPCAQSHKQLDSLLARFGDRMGITVRFTVAPDNKEDKKTEAVRHILQVAKGADPKKLQQILDDWFEHMDYEKFAAKWPVSVAHDVEDLLRKHEAWCKSAEIQFTPTIFVNGRENSKLYTAADLEIVAGGLIGTLEEEMAEQEPAPQMA
jgi:uncharacterized membrane protein